MPALTGRGAKRADDLQARLQKRLEHWTWKASFPAAPGGFGVAWS